jgi:hypothetical protein
MKNIFLILFLFVTGVTQAQNVVVDFNKIIVDDFAGFGTQYNQNVYSTFSAVDGITPENIGQLETKVKNLRSQYVRIFFDSKSWPSDPKYATVPSDFMESFIKTVKLAQDAGAKTINITYWSGPTPEKMEAFADLMYDLIVNRKLTAAREITLQNEPNGNPHKFDLVRYKACYDRLDEILKAKGIRDKIRMVGGDLVYNEQKYFFDFLTTNMTKSLDGYSFHAYWDDNDTLKPITRLTSVAEIANAFSGEAKKPVYITEYGVRGSIKPADDPKKDPGYLTGTMIPISTTTTSAMQNALFQINGMNLGFAGFIRWDCYKAKFDNGSQYYSCIGSANDGYPLFPLYYMTFLFTHTSAPGWQVVKTSSDVNVRNTFVVAAIKERKGKNQTVYAINVANKAINFSVGGLTPNRKYDVYSFNSDGKGSLKKEYALTANSTGTISGIAGAKTLLAITTVSAADVKW